MSRLGDKYRHIIKNAENRKALKIAFAVISLAVVFVVFAALSRPGITMTSDNTAENTPAGGGGWRPAIRGDGACKLEGIRVE